MSKKNKIIGIVAVSNEYVIGYDDGTLPWHIPSDLAHFKNLTTDNIVVCGNNTFKGLAARREVFQNGVVKVLPNRTIFIATRGDERYRAPVSVGDKWYNQFHMHLSFIKTTIAAAERDVFIIGGGQIYSEFANEMDEIYVTCVDCSIPETLNTVSFNRKILQNFKCVSESNPIKKDGDQYSYTIKKFVRK